MLPIEKNEVNTFNPNKEEEEKPFISHIQKPKKKQQLDKSSKRQLKIMPIFSSQHKI